MIWLASGSPRRRALLEWAGFSLRVRPAHIDESRDPAHAPEEHARHLARGKAATAPEDVLVVAADTVVHLGDRIFDKPADRDEARAHLQGLSGRWHRVTTGVCVRRGPDAAVFSVTSEVRFRELASDEIDAYVASGEGDDKAGAYGIQGRGGSLVGEVRGSWTNVMGLPMEETLDALMARGAQR